MILSVDPPRMYSSKVAKTTNDSWIYEFDDFVGYKPLQGEQ